LNSKDSDGPNDPDAYDGKANRDGLKLSCVDKSKQISIVEERSWTDKWFMLFWIAGLVATAIASIYGWANGDPDQLLIGWDSDQNGCGYSTATKDYPYLYWPQIPGDEQLKQISEGDTSQVASLLNYGVCVKECPKSTGAVDCKPTQHIVDSTPQFYKDCEYYPDEVGGLVAFRYDTKEFLGHYCLPDGAYTEYGNMKDKFKDLFFESAVGDAGTQYAYDIAKTWPVILVASIITVMIGYLYIFIMKRFMGIAIWFFLAFTLFVLGAVGCVSYFYARPKYDDTDPTKDYVTYFAYVMFGLTAVYLLCVCCCCNSIRLAIAVFEATCDYINTNKLVLVLPFVTCIVSFIWYVIWLSAAIFIFSVGTPESREGFEYVTEIKWSDQTRYVMIYYVFAFLWINAFIIGMVQFIIGASTVAWYFSFDGDTKGKGTLMKAFKWGMIYHWSSVALGSLIIAICQMIRLIFDYYRKKMVGLENSNPWLKCLVCATGYCLWCLEKCVKYISKNAYIQVALNNCNFLTGAINAFVMIARNAATFGWVNTVGNVNMLFGTFFVTALSCFGTYFFLAGYDGLDIKSPIPTTCVMAIIAITVSYQLLSIFSFSSDAILQAYLTDESITKGKGRNRPKQMDKYGESII